MNKQKTYSEQDLVAGCVRNERRFQELLYRQYFPKMMGMCMRYTKDRDIAMQIVNNGFLRVFKKIDQFSFKGSLEGWIRRLVYHSVSDYFKKHSKYARFLILEERDDSIRQTALDDLYFQDVLRLVDMLPAATKEVFRLFAIEGYSHKEIAKQQGISVGTSKWHLSAARKRLKELLEQNDDRFLKVV